MTSVEWVEPVLTWANQAKLSGLRTPRVLEIRSDDFMEEFLQAMAGDAPHTYVATHLARPTNNAIKLYQPLHGCYYLVMASLVCRQVGLPDRDVRRNQGEKTGFVVRRQVGNVEEGWVNVGERRGWQALDPATGLTAGEEILPLHPVRVCTAQTPGLAAYRVNGDCERVVYQGYVPAGNRDKYTATKKFLPSPNQSKEQLFSSYLTEIANDDTSNAEDGNGGFRGSEFDTRVIAAWMQYSALTLPSNPRDVVRRAQAAYYIIVDAADFIRRALPAVWDALLKFYSGQPNPKAGVTNAQLNLLNRLLNENHQGGWNIANGGPLGAAMYAVRDVLKDDSPFLLPVAENVPTDRVLGALPDTLKSLVIAALNETPATPMKISNEFADLLREQVRVPKPEGNVRYYVRLVYTYDPDCPPYISERSEPLLFARLMDGDAPARKVRIEAPRLQDLRKFKPGVGIEMDKDLRDVLNRVHEGLKDGEPLNDGPAWELGMICTFSIQIIFLVALIVMFIFLILLNIIFWWLPFLKICLPIPKPK